MLLCLIMSLPSHRLSPDIVVLWLLAASHVKDPRLPLINMGFRRCISTSHLPLPLIVVLRGPFAVLAGSARGPSAA